MGSNLQSRIRRDLMETRAKIDEVHEPSKKARLINLYVDLLESLDVKTEASDIGS